MHNLNFEPVRVRFGSIVRERRKEIRLTQQELAEKAFCSKRTIINKKKGKGNPNLQTFFNLISFLEIDPCLIFFTDPEASGEVLKVLVHLLQGCSEDDLRILYPVIQSLLEYTDKKNHFSAI